MKKALVLLPVVALAACDRETSNAEVICYLPPDWRNPVSEIRDSNQQYDADTVNINIQTFAESARVTVDGETAVFEKESEDLLGGDFGEVLITYSGVFPGTTRMANIAIYGDISSRTILQYDVQFVGEKVPVSYQDQGELIERLVDTFYSCNPLKEEWQGHSYSSAVPFNHRYKMPNKTERCINEIDDKIRCKHIGDDKCAELYISLPYATIKKVPLSQEDALSITPNWDYSNIKMYENDGPMQDYEKDACDVLERLNQFIRDNYLEINDVAAIREEITKCGDECSTVIAEGDRGDYLIQVPETETLRKIANRSKDSRFASVWNPIDIPRRVTVL